MSKAHKLDANSRYRPVPKADKGIIVHSLACATVSEAVLNQFNNYSWPGNVRELRNTLERAVIWCEGAVIETRHLPPGFSQHCAT